MTDQQIISLFQARDERALTAITDKYRSTCMRIARRHLRTTEDAEECVNDVMLQLWQSIPPAEPSSLEAFIVTVTKHIAINMADRAHAVKRGGGTTPESLDAIAEAVPAHDTVEDAISHRLLTKAVERFLDTLSDDAQTIFVERYHNETAPREIAQKFGLSGIYVRKSLMRTRRKLKQFLTEEGLL